MWIVESIRQREHYELISTSLTDVSTEMPLDMISCVMQNLGIRNAAEMRRRDYCHCG